MTYPPHIDLLDVCVSSHACAVRVRHRPATQQVVVATGRAVTAPDSFWMSRISLLMGVRALLRVASPKKCPLRVMHQPFFDSFFGTPGQNELVVTPLITSSPQKTPDFPPLSSCPSKNFELQDAPSRPSTPVSSRNPTPKEPKCTSLTIKPSSPPAFGTQT
jgi:hypothetical protein